jgi:CRP-like cAMP-binding protein
VPRGHNHLIQGLPHTERARFLTICKPVELASAEVLCESGTPTRYVYFPINGVISLVTPIEGRSMLEVGMVGSEGMVGTQLVLGVGESPLHALVQGTGSAWRIAAAPFRTELARSTALRVSLNRYVCVTMNQLASSVVCQRFHRIGPRLARWLLMTQDRAHADSFHVTHEFLAYMLGVRRVGVTSAAVALQRLGLIRYRRGELVVLDRHGLEAAACCCYAAERKIYLDILH